MHDYPARQELERQEPIGIATMAEVRAERCTAEIDGDFVVFLIGMRINRFWKPHKWLPVAAAMPRMLAELARMPDLGLLHARTHFGFPYIMVVQYWRSFAHLHRYATDRDLAHLPAWKAFNQAIESWRRRHLARDLLGARRRARERLQQHAPVRARLGRAAGAGAGTQGIGQGAAGAGWR
jgi:Domain of unknown function (DUF4188)